MIEPLCGWKWYQKHRNDYTQLYIDNLTIVVKHGTEKLPAIRAGTKRKTVRDVLKDIRREG